MSRNLASWTQAPPAPKPDEVVQYVSINLEPDGTVSISVRNAKDECATATMSWREYVELVSEQNIGVANNRRRSPL